MNEFENSLFRFQNVEKSLCDTVCAFLFKKCDNKIGLKYYENIGWWLPFKSIGEGKTWNAVIEEILKVCLIQNLIIFY